MSEKHRPNADAAGLATFWLMAGMGTAMITGHVMLRLMQRMREAGGQGPMAKGPFGAMGWMFDTKPRDAKAAPEVTPPTPAPKPAKAAKPPAEDAEVVTPKLRLVEAGETMAAAAKAVTEAWSDAASGAVETAKAAGEKMTSATESVVEKTEAPTEAPAEVIPEAPALAEILEPETAPVEEPEPEEETAPVEEPAGEAAAEATAEAAAEPMVSGRPAALAAARGVADDLKLIKGVGPKLEGVLNELGYFHFDQIAAWGPEELAAVDDSLGGSGRATRGDWIAQAKLLASGGEVH